MIVNTVVKATLSSKQRRKGLGKRRKMMASMRSTPFSISQVMFCWRCIMTTSV